MKDERLVSKIEGKKANVQHGSLLDIAPLTGAQ